MIVRRMPNASNRTPRRAGSELTSPSAAPAPGPVQQTVQALREGRAAYAVRLFLKAAPAVAAVAAINGRSLVSELRADIGNDAVDRLIAAFTRFECYYCRRGLDR